MPLEFAPAFVAELAEELNHRLDGADAAEVLARAIDDPLTGPVAMVSSFGAESVVLLHMVSKIDRGLPVLFLETGMLFPETLAYQREVAAQLDLSDVRIISPDADDLAREDADGALHQRNTSACCDLRKARPLARALEGFDAWITGRKRFQGGARGTLEFFEADGARLKVNPLAHWSAADLTGYIDANDLPRHPLVAQGYPSIGCAPCTTRTAPGEDPRAGRWRGSEKTECGIHFAGGRVVRPGQATEIAL